MPSQDPVALALPFAASSASIARTQLKKWLTDLGQPTDVIEDSRLVVSELVGNAVRHARPLADGTVIVTWNKADAGLDIAVTDGGAHTEPHAVDAAASDLAGRGLTIVRAAEQPLVARDRPVALHRACPRRDVLRTPHSLCPWASDRGTGSAHTRPPPARSGHASPAPVGRAGATRPATAVLPARRRCTSGVPSPAWPASATWWRCVSSCPPAPHRSRSWVTRTAM